MPITATIPQSLLKPFTDVELPVIEDPGHNLFVHAFTGELVTMADTNDFHVARLHDVIEQLEYKQWKQAARYWRHHALADSAQRLGFPKDVCFVHP